MGAGRFSGLKTEQIVDRTPLVVLSFLNSNTLKHVWLYASLYPQCSIGIETQTLWLLLTDFVKLNPPLAQMLIKFSIGAIALSSVGTDFKRSST